jgi:hypothetical protein
VDLCKKDEIKIRDFFIKYGLANYGSDGKLYLTHGGLLFCCRRDRSDCSNPPPHEIMGSGGRDSMKPIFTDIGQTAETLFQLSWERVQSMGRSVITSIDIFVSIFQEECERLDLHRRFIADHYLKQFNEETIKETILLSLLNHPNIIKIKRIE